MNALEKPVNGSNNQVALLAPASNILQRSLPPVEAPEAAARVASEAPELALDASGLKADPNTSGESKEARNQSGDWLSRAEEAILDRAPLTLRARFKKLIDRAKAGEKGARSDLWKKWHELDPNADDGDMPPVERKKPKPVDPVPGAEGSSGALAALVKAKPIILPGAGRNITEFVEGLSKSLGILSKVDPERNLFRRGERLYVVRRDQYGTPIFEEMTPKRFVTWAERFIEIGRYTKKAIDELTAEETEESGGRFYKESMTEQISSIVLSTDTFVRSFPKIGRLLDVPIPVQKGEEIIYTKPGFNPDLEIYCDSQFTEVKPLRLEDGKLDLEQARKVIEQVHEGFQFADEQSKTHAVARLFTPYCRGLMGFEAKTPLWYFEANRPGAGKDYLSGITHTVYLGYSFEDTPIGNSEEETTKRISSALQSGRRMMHFANCQGRLDDKSLMQAVTGKTFNCRRLGSNSGASDLQLRNELDISLSANSGMTYQEDFERRFRKIKLAFFEEESNSRQFPNPKLHEWVSENRGLVLSAVATFVEHWIEQGRPSKASTFSSFHDWSQVVGGILVCGGFGDPCKPAKKDLVGGDRKTDAMGSLYRAAYDKYPNEWIDKTKIYDLIGGSCSTGDTLSWFNDPTETGTNEKLTKEAKNSRTSISIALGQFDGRWLGGIKMELRRPTGHHGDLEVLFAKEGDGEPKERFQSPKHAELPGVACPVDADFTPAGRLASR